MSNNLVLGRGEIYFDRFLPNTNTKTGERYLGATPSFSVSAETQELEHYSSERGLRVKDESVTLQIDITGALTIENMTEENIALFFFGEAQDTTVSAAVAETDDFTVKVGHYYQLGTSDTKPEGVENVTSVSAVLDPGGANTALVAGTDYAVDLALGRVEILAGGALTDGDVIRVTYTVTAQTQKRVISGTTPVQGALRFISYNGVGQQRNFYMPKVTVRPSGEFALKGEEWQNLSLNLEILTPGTNLAALIGSARGVV